MIRSNKWRPLSTAILREQGRATITLGLQAGSLKFTKSQLVDVIAPLIDASILFQVGTTRAWGREQSASVVLYNTGIKTNGKLRRWVVFVRQVRRIMRRLAFYFAQFVTFIEFFSPVYGYRIETWDNTRVASRKRKLARDTRARARSRRR